MLINKISLPSIFSASIIFGTAIFLGDKIIVICVCIIVSVRKNPRIQKMLPKYILVTDYFSCCTFSQRCYCVNWDWITLCAVLCQDLGLQSFGFDCKINLWGAVGVSLFRVWLTWRRVPCLVRFLLQLCPLESCIPVWHIVCNSLLIG